MPVMDGYETCAELRKLDRETPIVFLSVLKGRGTDGDDKDGGGHLSGVGFGSRTLLRLSGNIRGN